MESDIIGSFVARHTKDDRMLLVLSEVRQVGKTRILKDGLLNIPLYALQALAGEMAEHGVHLSI